MKRLSTEVQDEQNPVMQARHLAAVFNMAQGHLMCIIRKFCLCERLVFCLCVKEGIKCMKACSYRELINAALV